MTSVRLFFNLIIFIAFYFIKVYNKISDKIRRKTVMRTIKSIVKEHNKNYKLNYEATLSRNNIGFTIVDTEAQDLDDDEKENIDDDLDFIDIVILCYDYKNYLIDKCLEDLIEYNEDSTEDENLLNFKNFIVKKQCEILKQKIEEEKNMFVQERNTIYELLNNREKVKRRFKEDKISKSKLVKKYIDDEIADRRREVKINLKLLKSRVLKEIIKSALDKNALEGAVIYHVYFNEKLLFRLQKMNSDIKYKYNQINPMSYKDKVEYEKTKDEYYKMNDKYEKMIGIKKKYIEIIKQKDKNQKLDEKFQLLENEYDKALDLKEELDDKDFGFCDRNNIECSFYEERMNEINKKLDEIDGKLKQEEIPTIKLEDTGERQALITEINEKSSTLKSLQEQTAKLEKQENKDDKNNSDGWIIIE